MLETIIFLYGIFHQHRYIKQIKTQSSGVVAVSERQGDIPATQTAKVSWYNRSACYGKTYGRDCKTANGEIFDEQGLTLACDRQFPLGSKFRLTYGGNSIEARCNDYGNFSRFGRLFDLSLGSFKKLADPKIGVIKVKYMVIDK